MKLTERIKNLFRKEEAITDGYHTFEELYKYRTAYNAAFLNQLSDEDIKKYHVFKSYRHHDGEFCFGGGWFIVSLTIPGIGQVTNHYEKKYYSWFHIPYEPIPRDAFDGHTPQLALERLIEYFVIFSTKI